MHPQNQNTDQSTPGSTRPSDHANQHEGGASASTGGQSAATSTQQAKSANPASASTNTTVAHQDSRSFMEHLRANDLHAWIVSGATLLALVLILQLLLVIVLRRLDKFAAHTKTKWDDVALSVMKRVKFWLLFPALVWAASQSLDLPEVLAGALKTIAIIGLGIQAIILAMRLVDIGLVAMVERTKGEHGHDPTVASSLGVLRVLAFMVVGVVVVLLALDNLGVKVTPMLTGLGIGGVAVALAVQSILSDLFGSLTIILDKPFVVGDFIAVGDKNGTVERIGVKTTRVRALSGEQLVFANSDLLASRVQNFKRMQERRVQFTVGVVYDAPIEKVSEIPGVIQGAIERQEKVRFDRAHFRSFGTYSLEFEAVYIVLDSDYNLYMDIQQQINLEIMRGLKGMGVQIGLPAQPFTRIPPPAVPGSPASTGAAGAPSTEQNVQRQSIRNQAIGDPQKPGEVGAPPKA